jgi:DNA invertase Pin-like site-specific DNA recombinase
LKYGYARISTVDQNPDMQKKALQKAGCESVFTDKRSGATIKRPALAQCRNKLKPGDTLIVWKLDRLARSLADLIEIMRELEERGVQFRSLTEEINTGTPGGKLTFHIFAALAEFERGLIIERTREGIKAARSRGVKFGRKPKLDAEQIKHARELLKAGKKSREQIAALFKVTRKTLHRALAG